MRRRGGAESINSDSPNSDVPWRRLGEFIEVSLRHNQDERYGIELIEGVNSSGEFCTPKANLDGINLKPYKIVNDGDFVYNPSRINIGSLSYRTTGMCIVSHLYVVFHLTEYGKKHLVPEFLWLFFNREDFRRLITYRNFGSQRPEFNFYQMSDIEIPVPSIKVQRKVVEAWQGLRRMKEENEKLAEPLMQLCRSYLQECKKKYPMKEIGPYVAERVERNEGLLHSSDEVRGLSTNKAIIRTMANLEGVSLSGYKVVRPQDFAYVADTSRRGDKVSYGFNDEATTYLVSSISTVFEVKEKDELEAGYLNLWLCRPEFDRYARFNSWGSARETFNWADMCRVKIPLPPIGVQQAIVDVYRCANEAKKIAEEADRLSREICPALVRWAADTGANPPKPESEGLTPITKKCIM